MSEIHVTCRVRLRGSEQRFLAFVRKLQFVVDADGLSGAILYKYFLSADPAGRFCYIHEAYSSTASFVRHMSNIKPLLTGMEELFDIETLDICGPLPPEIRQHFADLYGSRFMFYPIDVALEHDPS